MLMSDARKIIEQSGGQLIGKMIFFPKDIIVSELTRRAIEVLVRDWDFIVSYEGESDD